MAAIKTTQMDGDLSLGRNLSIGGKALIAGSATVSKNLRVEGWFEAPNLKTPAKGMFTSVEKLRASYPKPADGCWAIVGTTLPGELYVSENGEWCATGESAGTVVIDSEQYREDLLQRIQGKSGESRALDDPFIWLGEFNDTITDGAVTESGTEAFGQYAMDMLLSDDFLKYTGHGRAIVRGTNQDIWTYFMGTLIAEYTDGTYELKFFAQKTRGRYGANALGNLARGDDHDILEAERKVTVKRFVNGSPSVIESASAWVDSGATIKDLGEFNSTSDVLAAAAKVGIVRDYRIAVMVARVNTSDNSKKSSIVINQQITANSDGTYTTWQYIFEKNQRYTRNIQSNATAVTSVQSVQKDGVRNLEYGSLGYLKLTDMHGSQIGASVHMKAIDQSALREESSTTEKVRLVQTKTFGNTNEVLLTPATSAKAGVMTAEMYNTLTSAASTAKSARTTANEAKTLATSCDSKINKYAVRYMTPSYGSDGVSSVVCKMITIPISATNTNTIKNVTLRIGTGSIPPERPVYMHIINGQTGQTFGSSERCWEMDTNIGKYLTWTFGDGVKISDGYGSYVAIGLSTNANDVNSGVRLNFHIYANKNATNNEIKCVLEDGTWQSTWQPELAINIAVPNELVRLKGTTNAEGIDLSLTDVAGGNESASVRIPVAGEGTIGLLSGDVVKEIQDKQTTDSARITSEVTARTTADTQLLQRIQGREDSSSAHTDPILYLGEWSNTTNEDGTTTYATDLFDSDVEQMLCSSVTKYLGRNRATVWGRNADLWCYYVGNTEVTEGGNEYDIKTFALALDSMYKAVNGYLRFDATYPMSKANRCYRTVKIRYPKGVFTGGTVIDRTGWEEDNQTVRMGAFTSYDEFLAKAKSITYIQDFRAYLLVGYIYNQGRYSNVLIIQDVKYNGSNFVTIQKVFYEGNIKERKITSTPEGSITSTSELSSVYGRNLTMGPLKYLKLTDINDNQVGSSVDMRGNDQSALREGNSTVDEVHLVQTKTFGTTNDVSISSATSAKAGVMTAGMYTRLETLWNLLNVGEPQEKSTDAGVMSIASTAGMSPGSIVELTYTSPSSISNLSAPIQLAAGDKISISAYAALLQEMSETSAKVLAYNSGIEYTATQAMVVYIYSGVFPISYTHTPGSILNALEARIAALESK